ncbi:MULTISPECIES: CoA transferase [unclassified Bradyrhizobium]|uniref:CaiB/BaiF CoA transferase family protein n=1 Tax=unclassified Bradyrhizobium TaxID=2631580 RepID=UPI001FFAD1BB|nr:MULTISPECIES: CoA transferase [unclassified Bradyrhizobium]MCK1522886.1 CoA transferase [Bradyrhizobium sp. 17]MCK1686635.1 CoA transferase [Bradyrhizobium sp. 145]
MLDNIEVDFPEHTPRPSHAPKALEGIRVVDFSHFIAGPFATMILADMGAEVIKIEAPGRGDDLRRYPPVHPELKHGAPFVWTNRNKQSVALDLKSPEGVAIARELVATADVVVENFSTGVMERFGLDYEACRKIRPKIIYCSVSAYGREGTFADRLGFDPIAQVESGFVSMNGYADREGVRALSPVMDISTAMMACNAILGALVARERSGMGQAVEVSLFDNAVLMTGYATMQHLFSGANPQRHGNTSPDTCPSGVFQAQDCSFYINCGNDKIFQRLMSQVIDRADLAVAEIYATGPDRIQRRDELFAILGGAFAQQPWPHWQSRMRAAGVPCGQVRTVGEAIRSAEARERGLVTRIPHDTLGWVPNVNLPIRYSRTPIVDPVAAPAVGQHTESVLSELLGYDDARLARLTEAGAFGADAARPPRQDGKP